VRQILGLPSAPAKGQPILIGAAPVMPRREFKQTFEPKPGHYTAPDEFN